MISSGSHSAAMSCGTAAFAAGLRGGIGLFKVLLLARSSLIPSSTATSCFFTASSSTDHNMARLQLVVLLALVALECAQGFAFGPGPQQQQPQPSQQRAPPSSPYERRDRRPPTTEDGGDGEAAAASDAAAAPFVLGPGSRVAVAGADSGALGRLITKKLFQSQLRPYLLIPNVEKPPSGLGLDQYKGLTRYIATTGTTDDAGASTTTELDGLVLCSEKGYSAKDVKSLLARVGAGSQERLKRVVMLSNVGVNRRDDLMLKLRQRHANLDERHAAEAALMEAAAQGGFSYTLVRVGKLRGGGGEQGLGFEYYDKNPNPLEARLEEDFDLGKRGFTLSYCDNIEGETNRILAAETVVKALASDHVANVALAIVSEDGRTFPNFAVAPWDLF